MRSTRRTLFVATLSLAAASLAFGQSGTQERQTREDSDDALSMHYLIVIDGKNAAWAKPPKKTKAEKLNNPSATEYGKGGGDVAMEEITLSGKGGGDVAMEEITRMSTEFDEWIKASFSKEPMTKSGEIRIYSSDFRLEAIGEFTNATISEITLPALDGSSKEPAYMKITLSAEDIVYKKGDGKKVDAKIAPKTKKWQASSFKISIGDLPCSRVSKIDSLTWKQSVPKDEVGSRRESAQQAPRIEFPNIKITVAMSDWQMWEDSMTSSQLSGSKLKGGSITVMGPDRTTGYTIELFDISIVSMSVQAENINIEDAKWFVVCVQYRETDFNFISR